MPGTRTDVIGGEPHVTVISTVSSLATTYSLVSLRDLPLSVNSASESAGQVVGQKKSMAITTS